MNTNLKGIFPALLTPFDKEGKINEKALESLIEMNIKKNVSGFYVSGSTGEAFLLTEKERKYLYSLTKEIVGDRKPLIAHVGAISTEQAIEYAKIAEKEGYAAISSVAPFYFKFSVEEIKQYYFDVVNSVSLPMIVYNIPAFSGVSMSMETLGAFLNNDKFIGVKHTSNDFFALNSCKHTFPDKLVYNGYDEMFLAGLAMGADGGIGSTYNFMAEKFVALYNAFHNGDMKTAQKIQDDVCVIVKALCKVGVMQGEKALLEEMGLDFGECRKPFAPITKEARKELADVVLPLLSNC